MKRVGILAFLMLVVIAGGVISSGLLNSAISGLLIVQTSDPYASAFEAPPQKAMQIVVWGGFVIANVVVVAVVLALFFWLVNRALTSTRGSTPNTREAPPEKSAE